MLNYNSNKRIKTKIRKFEEYVVQKFIDSIAIRQTKMKNEKNKIKYATGTRVRTRSVQIRV